MNQLELFPTSQASSSKSPGPFAANLCLSVDVFYLGTHQIDWLNKARVPLFVSHRRLKNWRRPPKAAARWALDSGGFSELSLYGGWRTTAVEYVRAVRLYVEAIGLMDFAAIQDWMVEEVMLKRTGLTVQEHQRRTVSSYLELRELAPEVPWLPVLQGWTLEDYRSCAQMYSEAGVNLQVQPRVGVGTMCRRQATNESVKILRVLSGTGLRLHGFGFKSKGLIEAAPFLASADSLAWSYHARKAKVRLDGCPHKCCSSCMTYALQWREDLVARLPENWRHRESTSVQDG